MYQLDLFQRPEGLEEQFHELVLPALSQMLTALNMLPEHISFERKKAYSSLHYIANDGANSNKSSGLVIYTIKLSGKTNYIRIKKQYKNLLPIGRKTETDTSADFLRVPIDGVDDALFLRDALAQILMATVESAPKAFDCCSRYAGCSNKKQCIHPNPNLALNCSYKFKLARGIIFYGENRTLK